MGKGNIIWLGAVIGFSALLVWLQQDNKPTDKPKTEPPVKEDKPKSEESKEDPAASSDEPVDEESTPSE